MAKTKEQAPAPAKAAPTPTAEREQPVPEKQPGRVQLARGRPAGGGGAAGGGGGAPGDGPRGGAAGRARSAAGLQQTRGNSRLGLSNGSTVQTKLTVNTPGDVYEQEADQVADRVMREADKPTVLTDPMRGAIQRDEEPSGNKLKPVVTNRLEHQIEDSRSRGKPLEEQTLIRMEEGFNADFSRVRVHDDNQSAHIARGLNARAFTTRQDVFFGEGEYQPESPNGQRLIAHELTHVVQQDSADSGEGRASIQRDATNTDITQEYAQSLDDEAIIAEIEEVVSLLEAQQESSDETASLSSNLQILRDEIHVRQAAFSPPVLQSFESQSAGGAQSLSAIPEGGEPVDQVGIINRDGQPEVRLRATPDTDAVNVITTLPFNTHLQVIKRFPGGWFLVSTPNGEIGYVAADYVWTSLPEPNARLHRVTSGVSGTAIGIAENYYGQYADDWGQDLRFYVNVLAWANRISVPNTTGGWRQVHFQAGRLIWIPSHDFARSLKGVVNSGSISYNILDAIGLAEFIERVAELWDDFRTAISLSRRYLGEAIARHVTQALIDVLVSIAIMIIAAIAILAISTAIGAAIGAIVGAGAGAAPGAAAGFEVGMIILDWLGLAMLIVWIGQAMWETGSAFYTFLVSVWNARGDQRVLERAGREFAEAIGTLLGNLLEAIVLFAVSKGIGKGFTFFRETRIGRAFGETRAGEWLNERVRRVRAGETGRFVGPRRALARFYRGVEIVDASNRPLGDFDGVDLAARIFVEHKAAIELHRVNPRTGRPGQTVAEWAAKNISQKTSVRIRNLASAARTRGTPNGSRTVPTIAEIQGIRHIHFVIDGNSPALRAAVFAELANLRAANPGWTFSVEFGVSISIPPTPDLGIGESPEGE